MGRSVEAYLVYGFPVDVHALPNEGDDLYDWIYDTVGWDNCLTISIGPDLSETVLIHAGREAEFSSYWGETTRINPSILRDIEYDPEVNAELGRKAAALGLSLDEVEIDWYLVSSGD